MAAAEPNKLSAERLVSRRVDRKFYEHLCHNDAHRDALEEP